MQSAAAMRFMLCLLCACATDGVERDVTIVHGVYGQIAMASGVPISVFARDAAMTLVAMTASDGHGVYQFELAPAAYELCTYGAQPATIFDQWQSNCAGHCTFVDVGDERLRADWDSNLSGGWWSTGDHCPR